MRVLGYRLSNGITLRSDVTEGERWLHSAFKAGDAPAATILGLKAYAAGNIGSASALFLSGYQLGDTNAGIDLAYMIRRLEVPSDTQLPCMIDLLAQGITEKSVVALVNYALCLASGCQCARNWESADQTIASITELEDIRSAVDWWQARAIQQDPEGHLVLGLLVRHRLIADPEGWTVALRFQAARNGGWDVPDWMFQPGA
jgi:hypothetical protein